MPLCSLRFPCLVMHKRFNVCCTCVRAGASDPVTPGSNVPAKRAAQTADGARRSPKTDDGEQADKPAQNAADWRDASGCWATDSEILLIALLM
eukprot:2433930-Pleurochrysis_carterae.AAC.1